MAKQPFVWGGAGRKMTPEEVDRQRLVAQALMGKGADFSPAGHWTEAMGRAFNGWASGRLGKLAGQAEEAGMSAADALVAPYLGGTPNYSVSSMGGTAGGSPNFAPAAAPDPLAPSMGTEGPIYPNQMTPGGYAMGEVVPTGSDAASIKAGLIARGLPEHVADGFIMNFMDESGLNPGINEIAPIVPGSRGGFGLYQLTGPRRTAYEQFAAQRGVDPSDVDAQLDWLMYELGGPEKNAAQAIMAAPDAGSAGAAIVDHFLRPAPEHEAARIAKYTGGGGNVTASTMGGSPVASALMSGPGSAELLGLMADPWVQRKYGPVLQALAGQAGAREQAQFEYAMKTQDPMYALGLEKAQLELDALRNPAVDPWAGIQEINGQLVQMTPNGPAVIGDYRTPEGVDQPASVQEYMFYADQEAAAGRTPLPYGEWSVAQKQAGASKTSVDVSTGGGKFEEAFAKGDAETVGTVYDTGLAATRNLGRIDQLETLLSGAPSGLVGGLTKYAGEWGVDIGGLGPVQAAQAMINSLVPEQRPAGSGPMSDADLELFKQSLPRIINTPEGNQLIISTMRGIAQYDAEGARIVQMLRANEIDRATAFQMLQDRKNPLDDFKKLTGSGGDANSSAAGADAPTGGKTRKRFNPVTGAFE